jgi:valacyclovir hydrolase
MLHGFSGTAQRHFQGLISEFCTDHRVIAPDLRGYGASHPPPRDFPRDFYQRDSEDVAALIEALNCAPALVFGFSDGGEAALILASTRPDLIRALAIWGAFGRVQRAAASLLDSWERTDEWGPELQEWKEFIIAAHGEDQWPRLVKDYVATIRNLIDQDWDLGLRLSPGISCPVLQLHGETERAQNEEDVQALVHALPQARLEIVPNADHFIQKEQPALVAALLRRFIAALPHPPNHQAA